MQTTYNGKKISYTIFGGSHENEIGIEASGLPKGFEISQDKLNTLLKRRATGNNAWSSKRKEIDIPIFESGISDDVLDGGKLRAIIKNNDIRSQDYDLNIPRPSHADYTAHIKYGSSINMSGGGPFSGRMTAPLCILGGICLQILETYGITIAAHITQIGTIYGDKFNSTNITKESLQNISTLDFPVENESTRNAMKAEIENAAAEGDSVGGIVECVAINVPVGIGGPLTDGLESSISSIIFGIPAVRGIEFGAGFEAAQMHGSKHNDPFCINDDGKIITKTNNHGGILGGISSGMPIIFRVAFKPTPSISKEQDSINLQTMQNTKLAISGRHDPCIVPRAVPVVEAACAIAILDAIYDAQSI